MNGKKVLVVSILCLGIGALLWALLPSRESNSSEVAARPFPKTFLNKKDSPPAEKTQYSEALPVKSVPPTILEEAQKVGMIDNNPEESEKRLDELSQKLTPQEIQDLSVIAKTPSKDGDLRALAADLLARNKNPESVPALEDIASSTWPQAKEGRLNDFEKVIRGRAIEGLQNHPSPEAGASLARAHDKAQDSFLADYSQRAMMARDGKVPKVEEQSNKALEDLLKK
jgi:hypothetical protein